MKKTIHQLIEFIPLAILFSILTLSFSLLLSQIYTSYKSDEQVNKLGYYNFQFGKIVPNTPQKKADDSILEALTATDAPFYLLNVPTPEMTGGSLPPTVLANFTAKRANFKLYDGRYFTDKEVREGTAVALISKTVWAKQQHPKYMRIGDKSYQIIGIIEDYRMSNLLTSAMYLNPSAYLKDTPTTSFSDALVSQNKEIEYQDFISSLNQLGYHMESLSASAISTSKTSIAELSQSFLPIFFIATISLVIVFLNFFKKITIEIGIKKMLGWTNASIIYYAITPLLTTVILSVCLGAGLHYLLSNLTYSIPEIYLFPMAISFISVLLTSFTMTIFMAIRISKVSPLSLIKGRSL